MSWITLIVAGLFEMGFTFCLGKTKESAGLLFYVWGTAFIVTSFMSMFLLAKAAQRIPLGTAYPVWTGIGAVGIVLMGIFFFKEPVTLWRMFFIVMLIVSIIGLKSV